jgi:hypothetical protein
MNKIPFLSLRVPAASEYDGIDSSELGEFAYDYVENVRDCESIQETPLQDMTP